MARYVHARKVNYQDHIHLLLRKMVPVAGRDDVPDLVDDVMELLGAGKAHLFISDSGGAVVQAVVEENTKCINIVFGWCSSGHGIGDYYHFFKLLAKQISATRITSYARKESVFRLWKRHGFYKVGYNDQGLIKFAKDLR